LREYKAGQSSISQLFLIDILTAGTEKIAELLGLGFMPGPPRDLLRDERARVKATNEPIDQCRNRGILIDGERGLWRGRNPRCCLQDFL